MQWRTVSPRGLLQPPTLGPRVSTGICSMSPYTCFCMGCMIHVPRPLRIPVPNKSGSFDSDQSLGPSTTQDFPLDLSAASSKTSGGQPRSRTLSDRFVSIITESLTSTSTSSIPLSPANLSSESSSPRTPLPFHLHSMRSLTSPTHGIFDIPSGPSRSRVNRGQGRSRAAGGIKREPKSPPLTPTHPHHPTLPSSPPPSQSSQSKSKSAESKPKSKPRQAKPKVQTASGPGLTLNLTPGANPSDVAYVCPICGQMFSLHDRLAKHMASRHRSRSQNEASAKTYGCDVCKRSFARSDMLTRHMRLHTGIKPYTCRVCGQVFSRSDHLSTHQRTHTGEKPYRCPQCPYAACRRDMITRHMRTHARYEVPDSSSTSLMLNRD